MKKTIRIRADAGFVLGFGHVIRCIALGKMLEDMFEIVFYMKETDVVLNRNFFDEQWDVKIMSEEEVFFNDLNGNEIVVLDGYSFDSNYHQRIKNRGAILICIDDLHDRHFLADIIINHAPGVTHDFYKAAPYTRFLLGPAYALLRLSFQNQAKKPRRIAKIDSVLVCFGGSDAKNLTIPALKTILSYSEFTRIIVITGSAYAYMSELEETILQNNRVVHHHSVGGEEVIKNLLDVQLAIVPASGILFEVVACRTPAISGYYTDNQLDIYKGFLEKGAFYDARDFNAPNLRKAIGVALQSDPNQMIKNQTACIDGKSAERFIAIFNSLRHDHSNSC